MEIEVLMSGKEFVGFYRAKSPIGNAHLVNADQMAKLFEALEAKLAALEEWKESALEVESKWDCQAVGRLLGVQWGSDIRSQIQPGIESLQAEVEKLRKAIKKSHFFVGEASDG